MSRGDRRRYFRRRLGEHRLFVRGSGTASESAPCAPSPRQKRQPHSPHLITALALPSSADPTGEISDAASASFLLIPEAPAVLIQARVENSGNAIGLRGHRGYPCPHRRARRPAPSDPTQERGLGGRSPRRDRGFGRSGGQPRTGQPGCRRPLPGARGASPALLSPTRGPSPRSWCSRKWCPR